MLLGMGPGKTCDGSALGNADGGRQERFRDNPGAPVFTKDEKIHETAERGRTLDTRRSAIEIQSRESDMKLKRNAKLLTAVAGVIVAFAMVSPAAQAGTPNTGYTQFAGCPDPFLEDATISTCIRTDVTGGNFKMGNKNVPITKTITLVGGVKSDLSGFKYNSEGGLRPAKQQVPGGVIGLTGLDWLVNFLNVEALQLYAETELAGTPVLHNLNNVTLPIKVHLINPVLGSKCYVGSSSSPITLQLTTGTTSPPAPNTPITGKEATPSFDPVLEIFHNNNGIFVDNSFAAPGANGCTLTLFGFLPINIDGLINVASGLPSAAGKNETKQNFNLEVTNSEFVYE
jgi:hypothetical protein